MNLYMHACTYSHAGYLDDGVVRGMWNQAHQIIIEK